MTYLKTMYLYGVRVIGKVVLSVHLSQTQNDNICHDDTYTEGPPTRSQMCTRSLRSCVVLVDLSDHFVSPTRDGVSQVKWSRFSPSSPTSKRKVS